MLTPWGRSDELRERRLRPGPGVPRADVERNQRERLYGATVAVVDAFGYEGMSVGAIAAAAGVSRSALYGYFSGRQACFLATFEALTEQGLETLSRAYAIDGPWDARLAAALDALLALLVAQPAAARVCLLEAYASGSDGAELRERGGRAVEALVREALEQSPERAGMPAGVVAAMVGGIRTVIQTRLRRRQEDELPALAPEVLGWLISYERPEPPLRAVQTPDALSQDSRFAATTQRDRLFVALAEVIHDHGYADASVVDIVSRAGVSLSTFYENFEGKEQAFLAACDFGIDQAFAAVRHAWSQEQASGWATQVNAGMRELLAFMASEPKWAYTAMVEIVAAGGRARARRDRTIELFTSLIEPGRALAPQVSGVTVEALGGAVYSLMYSQIRERGAERLPEILPLSTFVLLAPFVGCAPAAEIANGSA